MKTGRGIGFRQDIQALRGLAVLLVILYHAGLGVFPGGYLGVDIFFVVSGFLITGIITRELAAGTFSFRRFYLRRARRLLPAAYTMLALTTAAAAVLLSATQFREYLQQFYGSILFAANVVLWKQTGYFAEAAYMKPLLHMWSLSLEEQYYLVIPLLLAISGRRLWLPLLLLGSLLSLCAALMLVAYKPSVTFFMLPTRFWELGIGSVGALLATHARSRSWAARLLVPALAALLIVPSFPLDLPHPGANALIVCLATLIVILAHSQRLSGNPATKALAVVGDFSYSLYLVHFPIYALTRAMFMSAHLPVPLSVALLILSIVAGYALYRWVEYPGRYISWRPSRLAAGLVSLSALTLLVPVPFLLTKEAPGKYAAALAPNRGIACQTGEGLGLGYDKNCAESDQPRILIWGDSLAAALGPAITASSDLPIAQASLGMCAPILGMSAIQGPNEAGFAGGCIDYTRSIIDYVESAPSVEVVALTGSFLRFLTPGFQMVKADGAAKVIVPSDPAVVTSAFVRTIGELRKRGKRVIIVSPPPQARFDLGRCWERTAQRLPNAGPFRHCGLTPQTIAPHQDEVFALLEAVSERADVPLIRLDRHLCRGGACATMYDGKTIYRDDTHFTDAGSALVGKRLDLGARIWREAR
jgi:peptidoglycan/LPS O-acetylase OafA/YrhL